MAISPWLTFEKLKELDDKVGTAVLGVVGGSTTFYVDPAGDDSNDGLTPSTAFASPQVALDTIAKTYNFAGTTPTVQLAAGTYVLTDTLVFPNLIGASTAIFRGASNTTTILQNDKNETSNANPVVAFRNLHITWTFRDVKMEYSGNYVQSKSGQNKPMLDCLHSRLDVVNIRFNCEGAGVGVVDCWEGAYMEWRGSNVIENQGPSNEAILPFYVAYDSYMVYILSTLTITAPNGISANQIWFLDLESQVDFILLTFNESGPLSFTTRATLRRNSSLNEVASSVIGPSEAAVKADPLTYLSIDEGTIYSGSPLYNNTVSGLTSGTIKAAIDEVALGNLEIDGPYADDTAAASGGIAVGQIYHTAAGDLKVRLT